MSGRAYARNPTGALGGATDINSYLPHRFRLAAPKVTSKAKELAIRRAIQRRCKEKNWKKVLLLRQTRLFPEVVEETHVVTKSSETESAKDSTAQAATDAVSPQGDQQSTDGVTEGEKNEKVVSSTENTGGDVVMESSTEVPTEPKVDKLQQEREELEKSKLQLAELEEKLKVLSHEKHEKFQQLKDLLIAEARAKSTPAPAKKRRLDTATSLGGSDMSPRMMGAPGEPLQPSPGLLRAQSFGGSSSVGAQEFMAPNQGFIHQNRDSRYR